MLICSITNNCSWPSFRSFGLVTVLSALHDVLYSFRTFSNGCTCSLIPDGSSSSALCHFCHVALKSRTSQCWLPDLLRSYKQLPVGSQAGATRCCVLWCWFLQRLSPLLSETSCVHAWSLSDTLQWRLWLLVRCDMKAFLIISRVFICQSLFLLDCTVMGNTPF